MRSVQRPNCPAALAGPGSPGQIERRNAIAFFGDPANGDQKFTFAAYKRPGVKPALESAFAGKCAYCESKVDNTGPIDVEHYRPKAEIELPNGRSKRPGYYWLAADWTNLLPSCNDCNRERGQKLADGTEAVVGKGIRFPLADEGRRASVPGDEIHEAPLLLDPCDPSTDPSDHLDFFKEGLVRPTTVAGIPSLRGTATIEVVALQRLGLVNAREQQRTWIRFAIGNLREAIEDFDSAPTTRLQVRIMRRLRELKTFVVDDAPYIAMARQEIEPFLAQVGLSMP